MGGGSHLSGGLRCLVRRNQGLWGSRYSSQRGAHLLPQHARLAEEAAPVGRQLRPLTGRQRDLAAERQQHRVDAGGAAREGGARRVWPRRPRQQVLGHIRKDVQPVLHCGADGFLRASCGGAGPPRSRAGGGGGEMACRGASAYQRTTEPTCASNMSPRQRSAHSSPSMHCTPAADGSLSQ